MSKKSIPEIFLLPIIYSGSLKRHDYTNIVNCKSLSDFCPDSSRQSLSIPLET